MTDIKLPPIPMWLNLPQLRDDVQEYAREAVRLNAQAVPDGWVLVPVEPTLEMLEAGTYKIGVRDCYRAMLSAAPAAPQPAQQDAKPIYQYQLATGGWIDQTWDSYEYNKANGVKGLRIVYEVAPQPAQQPLTDEKDALLRQALEALENGARVRNAEGGTKYQPPIEEAAIDAIRNHLGVKND